MFVAGIFHIYHKLYSPPPCSPPWHCFPPCLPVPAPAVVCPPDTGARTPESWWYLAATSPRPRPRWHLLRWRGQHCHLPRQPGEVRGRLPPSRSLERGRCGGEQAGHQNTAGASQPPAGGKLSELSTGIGEAFTRIRSMTAPDIWMAIIFLSNLMFTVYRRVFLLFTVFGISRGQILILATCLNSKCQVLKRTKNAEEWLSSFILLVKIYITEFKLSIIYFSIYSTMQSITSPGSSAMFSLTADGD